MLQLTIHYRNSNFSYALLYFVGTTNYVLQNFFWEFISKIGVGKSSEYLLYIVSKKYEILVFSKNNLISKYFYHKNDNRM